MRIRGDSVCWIVLSLVVMVLYASPSRAELYSWVGQYKGIQDFNDPLGWELTNFISPLPPPTVPGPGDYAFALGTLTLGQGAALGFLSVGTGTFSLLSSGSLNLSDGLMVGVKNSVFDTTNIIFNLSGSLQVNTSSLLPMVGGFINWGEAINGTFNQTAGQNTVNPVLAIGTCNGCLGTYNLSGGSVNATEIRLGVALGATGLFAQTGGQVTTTTTQVGFEAGSQGSYTQTGGTHTVSGALTVGYAGQGSYTLSDPNQTGTVNLTVGSETLGSQGSGTGTFTQTGGTHTVEGAEGLSIGVLGTGRYELQNGTLSSLTGGMVLGERIGRSGTFTQTGGSATIAQGLGIGVSGQGTYNLSGSATLNVDNEGLGVNPNASGQFMQSGGTHTVSGLLAVGMSGQGTYTLSGGTLNTGTTIIGDTCGAYCADPTNAPAGTGIFTQSGGTHTVSGMLIVGDVGKGTYELQGGSLSVIGNETVGNQATADGTFQQSGGTHNIGGNLVVGGAGSGGYFQNGGTLMVTGDLTLSNSGQYGLTGDASVALSVHNETINGVFDQSGGTHTVTSTLSVGDGLNRIGGTYLLEGGTLTVHENEIVANNIGGNGTFIQSGGTNNVQSDLLLSHNGANRGTYTLQGGNLNVTGDIFGGSGATIGSTAPSTLNIDGGTLSVGGGNGEIHVANLILGSKAGTSGTYTLSGTGSVTGNSLDVGGGGTGTFIQTGGTNSSSSMSIGTNGGHGTYSLSGGIINSDESVGDYSSTGVFNQSGGSSNTTFGLGVGNQGHGTYNLLNGILINTSDEYIGDSANGHGEFNQSGGTHTIAGDLTIGRGGTGEYNLSGNGQLSVFNSMNIGVNGGSGTFSQSGGALFVLGNETIGVNGGGGTFFQSDGNHTVSGTLTLGSQGGGSFGTYNLSGGALGADIIINNKGTLNYTGGSLSGMLTNGGAVNVSGTGGTFLGDVTNNGTFKVTGATTTFVGTFTNNGAYTSDPSHNLFTNLVVSATGSLQGGAGDVFAVSGNFLNTSTQNVLWQTTHAELDFTGGGTHLLTLAGLAGAGGINNFGWGTLNILPGNILDLGIGSGNALYVGQFEGLTMVGTTITDIVGGPGTMLYYDPSVNPGLSGEYFLTGGGQLASSAPASVPEPNTLLLLVSGVGGLALCRRYLRTTV